MRPRWLSVSGVRPPGGMTIARRVAAAFDACERPYYATEFLAMDALEGRQHEVYYRLEEPIEFLGYSLDNATPCPGDAVTLTLYWRAAGPIAESYKVFTHIEDPGVVWAQMDHVPQCGTHHTTEWQDGEVLADTYTLILSPETPAPPPRRGHVPPRRLAPPRRVRRRGRSRRYRDPPAGR